MSEKSKGMGGHQSSVMIKDEWLTPPAIIQSLGSFDLDPCSPINRPWPTAQKHYTIEDDGLFLPWVGRVWLNPPYGKYLSEWMRKMFMHDNGIALTFARTDTRCFQEYVFTRATSMLFMAGRITFLNVDGTPGNYNGGAPSVLISYGEENAEAIEKSGIKGKHVYVNSIPIIVVGVSASWKSVVSVSLSRLNGKAELKAIYDMVELMAPDKIEKNQFFKEKVRQTLQTYFIRVSRGYYSNEKSV